MIRAKFRCTARNNQLNHSGQPTTVVRLSAVMDEGNKSWAKYTPGGTIEMNVDNPAAFDAFELGKFYFVDFTIAPAREAPQDPSAPTNG